ncbi:MAG: glycosyltransferase, partial [bacterium]|nr:glycosyltransferase [bacterium]
MNLNLFSGIFRMMKKIKLMFIITLATFGGTQIGGAQIHLLNLIRHINKDEFEIYLIAGNSGILTEETEKLGVRNIIIEDMKNPVKPIKDYKAYRRIKREIHLIKPDIVHTHSSKAGFLGRVAAYNENVPLIIHTVQGFAFPRVKGMKRIIYRLGEKLAGQKNDLLICVSNQERRFALENKITLTPDVIRVIGNGFNDSIDWESFRRIRLSERFTIPEGKKVIGFIARLDRDKNPMEYLKGIKFIHDSKKG